MLEWENVTFEIIILITTISVFEVNKTYDQLENVKNEKEKERKGLEYDIFILGDFSNCFPEKIL